MVGTLAAPEPDRHDLQLARIRHHLARDFGALNVSSVGDDAPVFRYRVCQTQAGPVLHTRLRALCIERGADAMHECWEDNVFLNVQTKGTATCLEAGREFVAGENDLVIVDPRQPSRLWSSGSASFLSLAIARADVMAMEDRGLRPFQRVISGSAGIGLLLRRTVNLLAAIKDADLSAQRAANGMIANLLSAALDADRGVAENPDALVLQRMGRWVAVRMPEGDIALDEFARAFAFSRRSLYRFFARNGTTPDHWIRQQRLEAARHQLRMPRARVAAVALQVGFKDLSHFSRSFQSAYGVPPSAYRQIAAQAD